MSKIEEKVENLVTEPIEQLGYSVYDVTYSKEGQDNYLRIFIDSEKGISLNDCENVNNAIDEMLDEADYIKDQYFLEVSSPGLERVLRKDKHLQDNIGQKINIKTFKAAVEGSKEKEITGILKSFDKDTLTIEKDNNEIVLDRKNIVLIKKTYNW